MACLVRYAYIDDERSWRRRNVPDANRLRCDSARVSNRASVVREKRQYGLALGNGVANVRVNEHSGAVINTIVRSRAPGTENDSGATHSFRTDSRDEAGTRRGNRRPVRRAGQPLVIIDNSRRTTLPRDHGAQLLKRRPGCDGTTHSRLRRRVVVQS